VHKSLKPAALIVVAAMSLTFTACGGQTAPPSTAPAAPATTSAAEPTTAATSAGPDTTTPVTLEWWTGQETDANKLLDVLVKEFTAKHPNVTINMQSGASTTDDLLQKMSAGFASGAYPDISYAYGSWASELESSGKTLDLTDFVADPAIDWNSLPEAARQTAQPTGQKIIGFPAVVDNISLFYNKTIFDAAGVAYPTDKWTWDDFRAAAKKLTDPGKKIYGYGYSVCASEETTWQFWPQLWQRGGAILSDDKTTATFNSQAGVDALTFYRDMAVTDKSVYLDQTDTKFMELFNSNRIAMITSGPWELFDLQTAGTKYGVTVLPSFNGSHQTVSGPDLWVTLDHQDPVRAYWTKQFVSWLTAPAQDERWNIAYGQLPLRASEIDSAAFKAQVKKMPGLDTIAANSVNATTARPTVAGYVGLSEAIGKAIANVLQGNGDPKAALDQAATKANQALEDAA